MERPFCFPLKSILWRMQISSMTRPDREENTIVISECCWEELLIFSEKLSLWLLKKAEAEGCTLSLPARREASASLSDSVKKKLQRRPESWPSIPSEEALIGLLSLYIALTVKKLKRRSYPEEINEECQLRRLGWYHLLKCSLPVMLKLSLREMCEGEEAEGLCPWREMKSEKPTSRLSYYHIREEKTVRNMKLCGSEEAEEKWRNVEEKKKKRREEEYLREIWEKMTMSIQKRNCEEKIISSSSASRRKAENVRSVNGMKMKWRKRNISYGAILAK